MKDRSPNHIDDYRRNDVFDRILIDSKAIYLHVAQTTMEVKASAQSKNKE